MRAYAVGLCCFALSAALSAWLHAKGGIAVDDGFIVLRYAAHLLDGHGLVYNVGERVEGFSSPLWVALLAALEGLTRLVQGPDSARLQLLNRALGIAANAGCVVATFVFVRKRLELSLVYQLGAAAAVLLSWPLIFWSGAGLETSLFALLVMLSAYRAGDQGAFARWRRAVTGLLLAALAVCRPEGPLFVAAAGAASWASLRSQRRGVLYTLGGVGLVYAALLGVRLAYYGAWLPNTFHAKVGGGPLVLLRGGFYLYDYCARGGGAVLGLLALNGVLRWRAKPNDSAERHARAQLPAFALLATGIAFIFAVGGDGLYCFRFIAHVLPLVAAYAALGAHALELRARALARVAPWARWIGGAALGLAAYFAFRPFLLRERVLRGARNDWVWESEQNWLELGRRLGRCLPSSSLLATNIAGKVPYESRLPTLDLLGLTDAVIARTKSETMGRGYAGHEKANVEYVANRRPAVLFISVLERAPLSVIQSAKASARLLSATTLSAYAPLLAQADFEQRYLPALASISELENVPVFLRRDMAEQARAGHCLQVLDWH